MSKRERVSKSRICLAICFTCPLLAMAGSVKFLNYRDYLVIGTPEAIAIADVNNDGIPDAVAATGNGTQVLLGGGDGGFANPILISSVFSTALAVADFNNDGKPDIAI